MLRPSVNERFIVFRSSLGALSLLVCLSLVAAACGGGDPEAESQPATTTSTAAPPTTESAPDATEEQAAPAPADADAVEDEETEEVATGEEVAAEEPSAEPMNAAQAGHACIPPAAANQEPSGTVVYVLNSLGSQNWLAPLTGFQSASVMMAMNEFLLCRDHRTGFVADGVGQLAETWSVSEDWGTYTFNLRKGVQFHDGWGELTSADVKFSFELAMEDESRNFCKPAVQFHREHRDPRRLHGHPAPGYPDVLSAPAVLHRERTRSGDRLQELRGDGGP